MRLKIPMRFLVLGAAFLTLAWGIAFQWFRDFTDDIRGTSDKMEILMRNLSWNTNLENFTPYRKNDDLEFVFIAESENSNEASVNLSKLAEKIQITEILVNDVPTLPNNLGNVKFDTALKITVRGKAKDAVLVQEPLQPLLKIDFQKNTTVAKTPEMPKPTAVILPDSITVPNEILSSNIDQLVPLSGRNLDSVDRVVVGEKSFKGVSQNGKYFITVPKNTFDNGDYFLGLYLKNGQLVTTNAKLSFVYNRNPINVAAITPVEIKNDQDRYVVVQGNGFQKMISIQLSNNLIFKNALFTVVNDHVVSIKIPKWLEIGKYYFNIMDTAGIYEAKNMQFTVTR